MAPRKPAATAPNPAREEDDGLNAVKGLLILCVVLGHMHAVQFQLRPVYDLLYIFHVAGFLLLPFLFPSPKLSQRFLDTRLVRYGVPFVCFFTASTALFYLMFLRGEGITPLQLLARYATGLAMGNTVALDAAAGLKLFWFLPALYTLVCLRALWTTLGRNGRIILLALSICVNLLLGEMEPWSQYIPWGLPIALFIFPLGLAMAWLLPRVAKLTPKLALTALTVVLLALSWQQHLMVNLGDMWVIGISHPVKLALYEATMLSTVSTLILWANTWKHIPGLALLGKLSLPIYLTHAWVNMLLLKLLGKEPTTTTITELAILFPLVLAISLAGSYLLFNVPFFKKTLFPRDGKELKEGWAMICHHKGTR